MIPSAQSNLSHHSVNLTQPISLLTQHNPPFCLTNQTQPYRSHNSVNTTELIILSTQLFCRPKPTLLIILSTQPKPTNYSVNLINPTQPSCQPKPTNYAVNLINPTEPFCQPNPNQPIILST